MSKKLSQNISSTTLFNFTDTYEHLVSNLVNGFYCGDIYERMPFSGSVGYMVPMVSFCDIPLGQIKHHLTWYGNFGIGIKRDYARMHSVNPVWYYHSDNPIIKRLYQTKGRSGLANSDILPYLKQFLGKQKDLSGVEKIKKFYDEREWRFIPNHDDYIPKLLLDSHKVNENYVTRHRRETIMPLSLDKIEYIIVENLENKKDIFQILKSLSKKRNVNYENLISSVLTTSQIRKDF